MSEVTLRSTENQAELLQSTDISIYFSKMIAGRITLSPPSLLSSSYRYILPAKATFINFLGRFFPNISVMPRFIIRLGNFCFILRVSQNKTIFPCVISQPRIYLLSRRIHTVCIDVNSQTRLMFTITDPGNPFLCF